MPPHVPFLFLILAAVTRVTTRAPVMPDPALGIRCVHPSSTCITLREFIS